MREPYRLVGLTLTRAAAASLVIAGATARMQSADANSGSRSRGLQIVTAKCAACHAVGRSGASGLPGAPAFRDLHRRYDVASLAEALAEGIVTGHAAMPVFTFSRGDIAAIIAHLKSLEAP